jgi:hypothetical protein
MTRDATPNEAQFSCKPAPQAERQLRLELGDLRLRAVIDQLR